MPKIKEVDIENRIKEYYEDPSSAKEYLQGSLKAFIEAFHWVSERCVFRFADFHLELINLLESMVFDKPFNLLVNICPRSGKSEIFNYFEAWTYTINPHCNYGVLCYSDELVRKFSKKVMSIINSDLYYKLFGLRLELDTHSKSFWKIENGGEVRAVSMGGAITGFGGGAKFSKIFAGYIRIDDPQKPEDARSDVMNQNVIDTYEGTIKNRRNDLENTPIVIDMQRVSKRDLSAHILSQIEAGTLANWKTFIVPAIRKDGKSFFEEMFPIKALLKEKAANDFRFMAQYQQDPQTEGGNVIKTDKFRRYTQLPRLVYTKFFTDTAMTIKKASDYTVTALCGYDAARNCYLIDIDRGKWESPDVLKRLEYRFNNFEKIYGSNIPRPRCLCIENKANGIHIIQEFRRRKIPVQILEPKAKDQEGNLYVADKVQRIEDVLLDIEAGFYYVPHDSLGLEWMPLFIAECQEFTRDDSHAYDDQIDAGLIYPLKERQTNFIHPFFLGRQ